MLNCRAVEEQGPTAGQELKVNKTGGGYHEMAGDLANRWVARFVWELCFFGLFFLRFSVLTGSGSKGLVLTLQASLGSALDAAKKNDNRKLELLEAERAAASAKKKPIRRKCPSIKDE